MDECVFFRDGLLFQPLKEKTMSIDWMNSLVLVSFVTVWAFIGQFNFLKH